jgi:uncharacterized protein (DUF302 family)
MAADGLTTRPSPYGPKETADRLVASVGEHGMTVAARIDHAAAARQAGLTMRPAEVIVFGNPRAGTPLMMAAPTIAIDLPLKALVWQDEAGATWLSYNDPAWLAERHGAGAIAGPIIRAMTDALAAVAQAATAETNKTS